MPNHYTTDAIFHSVYVMISIGKFGEKIIFTPNLIDLTDTMYIASIGLGLWCLSRFQQYFSYIVAVSFTGGGNQSTWRKLTNFITCCIRFLMFYCIYIC